jgi:hypothetical protein
MKKKYIKLDHKTVAYDDVNWFHLAQDISLPGNCEHENLLNIRVP